MVYVEKSKRNDKTTTCCIFRYHMRKRFAAITTRFIFIPGQ